MNAAAVATPALVVALDGSCALGTMEIGGKAWGINRMRALGLPVPPAFAVTIHACRDYYARGRVIEESLWAQIVEHLAALERATGRGFGAARQPLLVSVRSGAAHSMPGMMDTVLNLGMNDEVEAALRAEGGSADFARDTRRRFVDQYRKVVLGGRFDPIPVQPLAQLRAAVAAVFDSWHSPRARVYRGNRGLSEDSGTAVTVQAMVFGNADARSGTGVMFSRNPVSGEAAAWGEWLPRGQGEDVVAGVHTPKPLEALREDLPEVHAELLRAAALLEADTRDIQDIEFTVEAGRLWLLQARVAKRSPQAALRAAVAFAEQGLISKQEAVRRISAEQARQLVAPGLAPVALGQQPLAVGEAACPGVATGLVVTDPEQAEAHAARGESVILARALTSPDDLHGVIAARGLITEQGGSTSHAAVVSRELGRPCIVGCGSNTVTALAGRLVTVDGGSGRVWAGDLSIERGDEAASGDLGKLIEWGLPLVAVTLLSIEQAPADTIDLDAHGEDWRGALKAGAAVRGRVLDTDAGIHAALAAGVRALVVRHRLPALLACLSVSEANCARAAEAASRVADFSELLLLRLLALKGRAGADILGEALAVPADLAAARYAPLIQRGWCAKSGAALRVTAAGEARLGALLAEERAHADPAAVVALYEEFCVFNAELKSIMTAWQIKGDNISNDHRDADYDAAVLQRLADLHSRVGALLARLPALSARLALYSVRLQKALARINAGERGYVAKVIADSYHTVWFELHEDLISIAGLKRAGLAR